MVDSALNRSNSCFTVLCQSCELYCFLRGAHPKWSMLLKYQQPSPTTYRVTTLNVFFLLPDLANVRLMQFSTLYFQSKRLPFVFLWTQLFPKIYFFLKS